MVENMTKAGIASAVLWAAYLLTLAASVSHLAWAFGTLEFPGSKWIGWLSALAVDAGLASLAYGMQQRKRAKLSANDLRAGVIAFAGISAFANFLHAVSSEVTGTLVWASFGTIDTLTLIKAVGLSASLPALVVYLGEILSADDARVAQENAEETQKARRTAERKESKAELARIEAEAHAKAKLKVAEERAESERAAQASAFKCVGCERTFPTQQGLAGHLRYSPTHKAHANGTAASTERVE